MDLRDIEAFRCVYEVGSINKAAKTLYLTQSGLSKAITKLEAEVGHPLFERSHIGVTPTSYARTLYSKVSKLENILREIESVAEADEERRELHVTAVVGLLHYVGAEFLMEFAECHPDIELFFEECSDRRVEELLLSGSVDIAFMSGPIDRNKFDGELYSHHRHMLAVSESDELAAREAVTHRDLDGRVVALLSRDYRPYANNVRWMEEAGAVPARLIEITEGTTGNQLAADGGAVAITTDSGSCRQGVPGVVFVPFEEERFSHEIYLASLRGRALPEDARQFADFALEWVERIPSLQQV